MNKIQCPDCKSEEIEIVVPNHDRPERFYYVCKNCMHTFDDNEILWRKEAK